MEAGHFKGMRQWASKGLRILVCLVLLWGVMDSVILTRINTERMTEMIKTHAQIRNHDEITAAQFPEISRQLIRYLFSGNEEALPEKDGQLLFKTKENLHLKDCAVLLCGMNAFRWGFLGLVLILAAVTLAYAHVRGTDKLRAMFPGWSDAFSAASLITLFILSVFLFWAILDWDSLFIHFHLFFFPGGGWLLDTEQDLLIQLMAGSFFVDYAKDILLSLLPVILLMIFLPVLNRRSKRNTP